MAGQELRFAKVGVVDDADFSVPGTTVPDDRRFSLFIDNLDDGVGNEIPYNKLLVGVTLRDAAGLEVVGTFKLDVLLEYPPAVSALPADPASLSSWKLIARTADALSTSTAHVVNVGGSGTAAVRIYAITGADVTDVFVTSQQWGA